MSCARSPGSRWLTRPAGSAPTRASAALSLVITTPYTYTLESLIQAGNFADGAGQRAGHAQRLGAPEPAVRLDVGLRAAQLPGPVPGAVLLLAAEVLLDAWRLVLGLGALLAWTPFMADFVRHGEATGHTQSIILGAVLAISAVQMFALGIIADQISSLRTIGIRTLRETRELHYGTLYAQPGAPVPGAGTPAAERTPADAGRWRPRSLHQDPHLRAPSPIPAVSPARSACAEWPGPAVRVRRSPPFAAAW